jgi:hypothetical protein
MSDVVDQTLLFSLMHGIDRELRLLRLQVDNLTPRVAVLKQSFHDLVGELAHGFGQVQQQMARQEKRLDAVDSGLSALRQEIDDSTARIIAAIRTQG